MPSKRYESNEVDTASRPSPDSDGLFRHPVPPLVALAIMIIEVYLTLPFDAIARRFGVHPMISDSSARRGHHEDEFIVLDACQSELLDSPELRRVVMKCLNRTTFSPCACTLPPGTRVPQDRTQVFVSDGISTKLLPERRLASPKSLPDDGAVFFGHSTIFRLWWPKDPQSAPQHNIDDNEEAGRPVPGLIVPETPATRSSESGVGSGSGAASLRLRSLFSRSSAPSSSTGRSSTPTSGDGGVDEGLSASTPRASIWRRTGKRLGVLPRR